MGRDREDFLAFVFPASSSTHSSSKSAPNSLKDQQKEHLVNIKAATGR
jgi:hypothetical protein